MFSSIRNYRTMYNTDGTIDVLFSIRMREKYGINTYYNYTDIETAGMEVLDSAEGCLINPMICEDSDGNVIIFAEKALNCWTSVFVPIVKGSNAETWDYWYENFAETET